MSVVRNVVADCVVDDAKKLILKRILLQVIGFTEMVRKFLDNLSFVLLLLLPQRKGSVVPCVRIGYIKHITQPRLFAAVVNEGDTFCAFVHPAVKAWRVP